MGVPALDVGQLVREILYLIFGDLTAAITAIIGPTYDNLLVPELQTAALFPAILGPGSGGPSYLNSAARFSDFLLTQVVDPAIALVALGVAVLYLSRSLIARWADAFDALLPRLVVGVVAANFTVPIAGALLGVAGALYPVVAGWDGGAWQQWANLAGWGQVSFSWDNGALAFVLSFAEFAAVFALLIAVGIRDAVLSVLLVLLPFFTLLWPFRPLSALARRGWFLFAECAFLPCVMVVPLELAVDSPNPVMLVSYLAVAVASPFFVSLAGTQLGAFGVGGAAGIVHSNVQRGLSAAPSAASVQLSSAVAASGSGSTSGAVLGSLRTAGSAAAPAAAPLALVQLLGEGSRQIVNHLPGRPKAPPPDHTPALRGGGSK